MLQQKQYIVSKQFSSKLYAGLIAIVLEEDREEVIDIPIPN